MAPKWSMDLATIFPYIMTLVFGILSSVSTMLLKRTMDKNVELRAQRKEQNIKREEEREERERARDKLTVSQSRRSIRATMLEHLNQGYVTITEYDETEDDFKAYEALGGDGSLHHLHDKWVRLKVVDDNYTPKGG